MNICLQKESLPQSSNSIYHCWEEFDGCSLFKASLLTHRPHNVCVLSPCAFAHNSALFPGGNVAVRVRASSSGHCRTQWLRGKSVNHRPMSDTIIQNVATCTSWLKPHLENTTEDDSCCRENTQWILMETPQLLSPFYVNLKVLLLAGHYETSSRFWTKKIITSNIIAQSEENIP